MQNNHIDYSKKIWSIGGSAIPAKVIKDLGEDAEYRYCVQVGNGKSVHYLNDKGKDLVGIKRLANNCRIEKSSQPYQRKTVDAQHFNEVISDLSQRVAILENIITDL